MKILKINRDNEIIKILAQRDGNQIWYHYNGSTKSAPLFEKSKRNKKNIDLSISGEIKSPMPGKIIKICISLGQEVSVGDSIVVMEAMKMEYNLRSEISGKVEKVYFSEKDQVNLGELLVLIK